MKQKRRHDLQTNALADWLGTHLKQFKPYVNWLLGGAVAVLALILIYSYFTGQTQADREAGWQRFALADTKWRQAGPQNEVALDLAVKELEALSTEYAESTLATECQLTLGDLHRIRGLYLMNSDRSQARQSFEKAAQEYDKAVRSADDPLPKNRARYHLAQSYEWMFKLTEAQKHYSLVEGPLAKNAKQRAEDLKRPATRDFYERYAAVTPKPPAPPATRPSATFGDPELQTSDDLLDFRQGRDLEFGEENETGATTPKFDPFDLLPSEEAPPQEQPAEEKDAKGSDSSTNPSSTGSKTPPTVKPPAAESLPPSNSGDAESKSPDGDS